MISRKTELKEIRKVAGIVDVRLATAKTARKKTAKTALVKFMLVGVVRRWINQIANSK
jgi:hypothetical protein